jgi:hypothetical protein
MRRMLFALTLALAALAASAGRPPPARAGCVAMVVWHDRAYMAYWSRPAAPPVRAGARLRGALEPGCSDTGGPVPSPTRVGARTVAGVPAAVAILSRGVLMVAIGYFPQVRGFPLVRPGAPVRDATRNCRLGGPVSITGTADPSIGRLALHHARATAHIRVFSGTFFDLEIDGHTRMPGLARGGIAYIGTDQRVRVDGRFCQVPGAEGPLVVARTIVPAGPVVPASTAEDVLGSHWRGEPSVLHDRTTYVAAAVVAVGVAAVLAVLAWRRTAAGGTG